MTMTLVETIEVGSGGAASIEFTGVDAIDGDDLLLQMSTRADGTNNFVVLQFNGSNANFSGRKLRGSGSSASSGSVVSIIGETSDSADSANTFGNGSLYISNFKASSARSLSSDMVSENNASTAFQNIVALTWNDTSTITSISINMGAGNFVQYSTASLYKITKA